MINVCICNYNTNSITNECIMSIINNYHCNDYYFTIFDNSDKYPFINLNNKIKISIINNTESKIINFNSIIKKYNCDIRPLNNNGSLKHCLSIQYLLDNSSDDILLFDSDTILLKDIDFIDNNYVTICSIQDPIYHFKKRFLPYIQYFNIKKIKDNNIKYFDINRISGGVIKKSQYDTGCSFYEDVLSKKLNFKTINYRDYIYHYGNKSWK